MQMLHTHEAKPAGEHGSEERLVGGQLEYKTHHPPKVVLTVKI